MYMDIHFFHQILTNNKTVNCYKETMIQRNNFCSWKKNLYVAWAVLEVFCFNPILTNGFSHYYHLGESTFIFGGVMSEFYFSSHFSIKFLCVNRIDSDGTPRFAVSHLGLYCLPMSHKRDARLI